MNLIWGILILAAANAIAIGVMLLVRRGAPEGGYFSDSDRASGVFGVLATGFAIFAGFVVFLAFASYDQSRSGAETEALTVVQQLETAQFFPEDVRRRLSGELVCYARAVVYQEWPRMEEGGIEDTINPWGVALFRSLQRTVPEKATEQSAYDKWLAETSERELARQDRIHGASGIVPASIWIVLALVGGVVFAYVLLYADSTERARSQAMLMGSAATVVVATLLAIYALNNPFRPGPGSLQPVAMEQSLRLLDQVRELLGDDAPLPCDEEGVARG